ncbi:MAG: alpha/beta hydrolase [Solirubrobacteraceae bacterium]
MDSRFSAAHRGGGGTPMVCLHGFMETWRTWELVLDALERRHDVLAPTLAGHAGGPPFDASAGQAGVVDAVERAMDEAGFQTAHLVGNSLGGYVALQLATRGRASSVVALAPAGGWEAGGDLYPAIARRQAEMHRGLQSASLNAEAFVSTLAGRRSVTRPQTVAFEHIPADLLAHQVRGVAACDAQAMIDCALREGYDLDAQLVTCPVRIVWGRSDELLALPVSAVRYRRDWLPTADWVELDDVGHAPQLDVPLQTAQLILDFTAD